MKLFTSDLHLDNQRLFPSRISFKPEEWQEMIFDKINSQVKKDDRLYILGDFAQQPEKFRHRIKSKNVTLIVGNHDVSISRLKSVFGQEKVFETRELKFYNTSIWLSHYPHLAWPKSHYGAYHLYGHVHDQRSEFWENIFPEMRALDVCPESHNRIHGEFDIWTDEKIFALLSSRKGHDDVSWYNQRNGVYEFKDQK